MIWMAKVRVPKATPRRRPQPCVICGRDDVEANKLWTVDSLTSVAVVWLCLEHAAPLMEIILVAGGVPPEQQIPVPFREEPDLSPKAPPRGRSDMRLQPLLNWTPPADVPIPMPPELPEPTEESPS